MYLKLRIVVYIFIISPINVYVPLKQCCNSTEDVTTLRQKGQVNDLPFDGGSVIISSPDMSPFHMPKSLKRKPIQLWDQKDYIWLNM